MTKREIIFTILEKLKIESDDSDLTQEFVSALIDLTRAKLIKQTYGNKEWNIPIELRQELCLSLSPVSSVDGISCSGTILRTDDIIPKGISVKGADGAVLRIKRFDRKQLQINIVPIERLPLIGHNPFTSGMTYGAIDSDRRVYLLSGQKQHSFLEYIKVEGIYENPDDIWALKCGDAATSTSVAKSTEINHNADVPCEPWDEQYPLEASMIDDVVEIIIQQLIRREKMPEDNLNDAEDVRR